MTSEDYSSGTFQDAFNYSAACMPFFKQKFADLLGLDVSTFVETKGTDADLKDMYDLIIPFNNSKQNISVKTLSDKPNQGHYTFYIRDYAKTNRTEFQVMQDTTKVDFIAYSYHHKLEYYVTEMYLISVPRWQTAFKSGIVKPTEWPGKRNKDEVFQVFPLFPTIPPMYKWLDKSKIPVEYLYTETLLERISYALK